MFTISIGAILRQLKTKTLKSFPKKEFSSLMIQSQRDTRIQIEKCGVQLLAYTTQMTFSKTKSYYLQEVIV